jgi:16S rRNA (cytosine967-C5)-methyltransferase
MANEPRKQTTRGHAVSIVRGVIDQHNSLNSLLEKHQQELPSEQHAFLSQLCYGSLRWYLRLEFWLQKLMYKPLKGKDRDVHFMLILGLFQLAYLNKPRHAVMNETVNLSREFDKSWASGLINGVLRNFVRQQSALLQDSAATLAVKTAMPRWLCALLEQAYPQHYEQLLGCLNERAPMTLRVNSQRFKTLQYLKELDKLGIEARPSALASHALILEQPCDVDQLPGFYQGFCSVQDEAAQLVTLFLRPKAQQSVLDACCAPGGKTAALLEVFPDLRLVAVDTDAERQQRTANTLERLSLKAELITADAGQPESWWNGQQFDHILLDAPCSATGVIRRHPDIKHLRRPQDINQLSNLQYRLLTRLWSTLKTGGTLLYVTCSILPQENTNIIGRLLTNQPDAVVVNPPVKGDIEVEVGCQFLPQTQGHDGFYYCLLTKKIVC